MGTLVGDFFRYIWSSLQLLFDNLTNPWAVIWNIVDILLVAFVIYEAIILMRSTRAAQLTKGIILLLVAYLVALLTNMRTFSFILNGVMSFGIVVIAVIFQPELRRAIDQLGGVNSAIARIFRPKQMDDVRRNDWRKTLVAVCDAAERLAEQKVGALFVLERRTNLVEIIRTGTLLHSDANVELLATIFYEGTPLHDGAVVIREARIEAAGCFLPLSNNLEIGKDMGTRHRSALGMSENSDAVVVVVSEETGIISMAKSGVMIRRLDRQNLFGLLVSEMAPPQPKRPDRPGGLKKFLEKNRGRKSDGEKS